MTQFQFGMFVILIFLACAASFSHYDEDYISIDDLPVQDARLVRADGSDRKVANITAENPFVGRGNNSDKDWTWLEDGLKDIAYYLRSHKFTEYDRRYEADGSTAHRNYYLSFPRPPLRSLHWEVQKYCELSFLSCVEFLWSRVRAADLKRTDDTAIVIQEQRWKVPDHKVQMDTVEEECQKLKARDNILANPFQGPLERFQWRTTASYYMCWFTMNEVPDLRHLNEYCDNFAACLDPTAGSRNKDFRAKDDTPFACAMYSFCPDPCCSIKLLEKGEQCWGRPENPCYASNPAGQQKCEFKRAQNTDFKDIILNRWNVSCKCQKTGYIWDSSYGICVDVDECTTGQHRCDKKHGEACLNTPGSYKCVCKWGYTWSTTTGKCATNEAIQLIKMGHSTPANHTDKKRHKSIFRRLFKKIFHSGSDTKYVNLLAMFIASLFLVII